MKRLGFCFLVFVLAILLLSDPTGSEEGYFPLVLEADVAYADQRWDPAIALYQKAFLVGEGRGLDLYNAACCAALAGDLRRAREWLGSAVDHGWYDFDWMNQDVDLASLRAAPEWEKTLLDLDSRREVYEASLDIQLRAELKRILDLDQAGRHQFGATLREFGPDSVEVDALQKKIKEADERNLERVLVIIEEHGWPGASLVGPDGSQAAFLVVQHAPLDIQERLLPMMRQAVAGQELEPADLALLEDRVRTRNGQPQVSMAPRCSATQRRGRTALFSRSRMKRTSTPDGSRSDLAHWNSISNSGALNGNLHRPANQAKRISPSGPEL